MLNTTKIQKQKNFPLEIVLPDGTEIFCLKKDEAMVLHKQIQEYFRNGIEVNKGDVVFDVGANIGLFSLLVNKRLDSDVSIYAFEPIPAIFEILKLNAQRFNSVRLQVFPYGLSQETKSVVFDYFPNATALSTAYLGNLKHEQDKIIGIILKNLNNAPPFIRWLRWIPQGLRYIFLSLLLKDLFKIEQVTCQLRTISEVILEHDVQKIDLLKIDVEKSELDVILGIEEYDWQKIQQIVLEVHNLDHRVDEILSLLKKHGFLHITVEQEPAFKDTDIFNVYALRKKVD